MLVTGNYSPASSLTASVSVIDTPTIRSLNKRNLAELLKTVPGLLIEEQGGPGGLSAVSVRGGEANFTLVLVDGVPVNDPTNTRGGGFDFSNLDSALVERVEIVRGAQSAIYGSDALAGVINVITRRPVEGHRQQLRLEVGEDDLLRYGLNAQGKSDAFEYSVELSSRDDGELVRGSERDQPIVQIFVSAGRATITPLASPIDSGRVIERPFRSKAAGLSSRCLIAWILRAMKMMCFRLPGSGACISAGTCA